MSRRYEKLRRAALGEEALAEDRSGLVLFLRHGMMCWIRTINEAEFSQKEQAIRCRCSRSTECITLNRNNTVIKIFAAMTLPTQNRQERTA